MRRFFVKSKWVEQDSSFLFEVQEIKSRQLIQIMETQPQEVQPQEVPVENQNHHSVLSDHQQLVGGAIYRELKTLNRVVIQDGPHAGMDEQVLVHTRSIGDLTYTVKNLPMILDPNNKAVCVDCWFDAFTFQRMWDKNWNPSLGQPEHSLPVPVSCFKKHVST